MAKCPYCGNELERYDDNRQYCARCNKYFSVKQNAAPAANSQGSENNEIAELKARIAMLEAEKQSHTSKPRIIMSKTALLASPAWAWFKKYGKIILPSILVLIIFITLMVCLVGIRGIYVNVNNPNEFYSFTATNYEYHGSSVMGDYVDKGTWKVKGNTLYLTYKDPDFGVTVTDDYEFVNQSNQTLIINGDFGVEKTFKRISLINYSALAKKVKITFDPGKGSVQGSSSPFTAKVKAGNKIPAPEATREGCTFLGWYKSPDFKPEELFDENDAQWENATYYAKWDNPTEYDLYLGSFNRVTIKENDLLLPIIKQFEQEKSLNGFVFEYYYNDKIINENTRFIPYTSNMVMNKLISIHDSVTEIPSKAFNDHLINTSIFIPKSISFIAQNAFDDYCEVENIIVDENNETYASQDGILYDKTKTQILYVPRKIKGEITIPRSASSIDEWTFRNCDKITGIIVDNNNPNFSSQDGVLYNKTKTQIIYIPPTIKKEIEFPNTVTEILCSVWETDWYEHKWQMNNPIYIGKVLISVPLNISVIQIKDDTVSIYDSAFCNCQALTNITIPDSVTSIGEYAFSGCSGLTSVTIPDSVTSIDTWAFENCTALTSITIPDSVKYVGQEAFKGCTNLHTIYCEEYQPDDWRPNWHPDWRPDWLDGCDAEVVWGYNS